MAPAKLNQDDVNEIKDMIADIKKDIALANQAANADRSRLSFLEKICFSFIGLIVLSALGVVGTAVMWAMSQIGMRK